MGKTITVGRDQAKCGILLPETHSARTSRQHAIVQSDEQGQLWITDISSNGTTLNGQPLTKGKTYPLQWGDEVLFADEARLDWRAMERLFRRPGTGKETQFGTVARSFVKSLVDWESRSSQIALFFRMLPNPSGQLLEFVESPQSKGLSPAGFFLFGLAAFFFVQHNLSDDLQESWAWLPKAMPEVLRDSIFGVYLLLMGYLNYKFFRWFTSRNIGPRRYFYTYIYFQAFWQIILALLFILLHPAATEAMGEDNAMGTFGLAYLVANFWLFYHHIYLHGKLWSLSWWATLGCQLLIVVIVAVVVAVLLVAVAMLS